MNVQFEYSLGEPVKIKALENMLGHIDSLELDNNGKMYRVIYWFNGERKSAWAYANELESIKQRSENEVRNV